MSIVGQCFHLLQQLCLYDKKITILAKLWRPKLSQGFNGHSCWMRKLNLICTHITEWISLKEGEHLYTGRSLELYRVVLVFSFTIGGHCCAIVAVFRCSECREWKFQWTTFALVYTDQRRNKLVFLMSLHWYCGLLTW